MGDWSSLVGNQLTLGYRLKRRLLLLPHHLVSPLVDNLFNVLLDPISEDLVDNTGFHIHQGYWSEFLLFDGLFAWFEYQGTAGFID